MIHNPETAHKHEKFWLGSLQTEDALRGELARSLMMIEYHERMRDGEQVSFDDVKKAFYERNKSC